MQASATERALEHGLVPVHRSLYQPGAYRGLLDQRFDVVGGKLLDLLESRADKEGAEERPSRGVQDMGYRQVLGLADLARTLHDHASRQVRSVQRFEKEVVV